MKKKSVWLVSILIIIVLIFGFSWWLKSKNKADVYSTVDVKQGPLTQTVSEVGTLKPVKEVALNFLSAGRIKDIKVKLGDKVSSGTVLASLDDSALQSRRLEAEAGLNMAKASLSKILAGASSETISVSRSTLSQAQNNVSSAKIDLDKTKKSVLESIRQAEKTLADLESSDAGNITTSEQAVSLAKTSLDNTIKNGQKSIDNNINSALLTINDKILSAKIALDNINTLLEDDRTDNVLGARNSITLTQTKDYRLAALALIPTAESAAATAKKQTTESSISLAGNSLQALLEMTDKAVDAAYAMLEASVVSSSFTQTNLDSYKTIISSQNSQINAASSALETTLQNLHNAILNKETSVLAAEENLRQAQVALENARNNARNSLTSLKLSGDQQIAAAQARLDSANNALMVSLAQYNNTNAPARSQDVSVAQAQVAQAQATLDGINQQIKDSILISPLDGVINQLNYEVGEQFGAGSKSMISILVNNSFNVEVDISESNISKIKIGNPVELTFDAFPSDLIIKGTVSFIEPAQTLIQDVVYYKVKIDFLNLPEIMTSLEARSLSLKSGMTTNVVITTDKRDQVLQVPARALIEEAGQKFVRLLINGNAQEIPVELGLQGDEGMVEVIGEIKAGDKVITFIKTATDK